MVCHGIWVLGHPFHSSPISCPLEVIFRLDEKSGGACLKRGRGRGSDLPWKKRFFPHFIVQNKMTNTKSVENTKNFYSFFLLF